VKLGNIDTLLVRRKMLRGRKYEVPNIIPACGKQRYLIIPEHRGDVKVVWDHRKHH
jgi:hypothetical protein